MNLSKQLCLGNVLFDVRKDTFVKADLDLLSEIHRVERDNINTDYIAQTVPLTENWLKACGYRQDYGNTGYHHITLVHRDTLHTLCFIEDHWVQCQQSGIEVLTVHALQNLFAMLYHKELEVKI